MAHKIETYSMGLQKHCETKREIGAAEIKGPTSLYSRFCNQ
jgi:hypothetical protein